MPTLTFYPIGNADCCLIDLAGGQKILVDYAHQKNGDDPADKRIDLEQAIRDNLDAADRDAVDVFCNTHLDKDHICRSSEIFWLQHARRYQGEDRYKIKELWVPAAVILEEGCDDETRTWRQEARHRLKEGRDIRVFSRPELLEDWLKDQGLTLESRKHLIVEAGTLVPTFTLAGHGVEFFVHSPMAKRLDDGGLVDRNKDSIFMQAVFEVDGEKTRVMLSGDVTYEIIEDIVYMTEKRKRTSRLEWDLFALPHHCSYKSLGPDKGTEKTVPTDKVKKLYETYGHHRGIMVSTSDAIPIAGDQTQPPHGQAANYYRGAVGFDGLAGEFKVTMEHPNQRTPKPLVISIGKTGARVVSAVAAGAGALTGGAAPRVG